MEGGAAHFKVPGDQEMHLLPAAPSHQFNQENASAFSPNAILAQLVMGKGQRDNPGGADSMACSCLGQKRIFC